MKIKYNDKEEKINESIMINTIKDLSMKLWVRGCDDKEETKIILSKLKMMVDALHIKYTGLN